MTLSVAEYSAKFEEAKLRCSEFHVEDQFAVCTCLLMVSGSTFKGWLNCMFHTLYRMHIKKP